MAAEDLLRDNDAGTLSEEDSIILDKFGESLDKMKKGGTLNKSSNITELLARFLEKYYKQRYSSANNTNSRDIQGTSGRKDAAYNPPKFSDDDSALE